MPPSYLTTPTPRHSAKSADEPRGGRWRYQTPASLTLERYFQDLHHAETPASPSRPQFHTGRLPNSKLGDSKPRLLLMGQRRSGKSSISSVVFHKMPPTETLFLESTARIQKDSMHSFMDFQVWDLPGQLDFLDPAFDVDNIFGEIGALIWVIDAQDEYLDAINRLNTTILNLQRSYPNINIEVFIHKVDGLSEDYKADTFRDIIQRIQDELSDAGYENVPVNFYQTSIYDHSIFEAFSKVIQKLIPQLPTLESLLNSLCNNCRIEKAYLFDVLSKIYIATDTTPSDISSYEICSDYIDVIVDVSEIYGWDRPGKIENGEAEEEEDEDEELQNADAESIITLQNDSYIYLREINK
ncbi:MAG: GTP-binding protein gtr2 [Sarea resinae]|nr:MAG: GTP-binding protein gtr2 [Sarea resinae]